jgi:hypothetical protein
VVDNNSSEDLAKAGRLKQIRMVAKLVNQQNKRALPITAAVALGIIVVFVLVGLFTNRSRSWRRWACCSACPAR